MSLKRSSIPDAQLPFAERVHAQTVGSADVLLLPTPVRSVVTWRGSFLSAPRLAQGDELLQEVTVSMLDQGTRNRDRFEIAEVLDDLGAQLDFQSSGLRVRISGKCLRQDVPTVLALTAEQLREPNFDEDSFARIRAQVAANLQRSLESTGALASTALSQHLFDPLHPNYDFGAADDLERLATLTLDDVRAYHAAHFGSNNLTLAFTGDLDETLVPDAVGEVFGDWAPHSSEQVFKVEADVGASGAERIPMADKANVDVRMGHTVPVKRADDDYMPLYVGNYILGGNFSARLMTVVRDEKGLTYGIHSSLVGIECEHDGHWQTGITLSHDRLEEGIEATRDVVETFVRDGITEAELEEKQTTITGSFKVGLATTSGLATTLLISSERGFGPAYFDRFPEEVNALTADRVNAVIQRYLDPDRLYLVMAGVRDG